MGEVGGGEYWGRRMYMDGYGSRRGVCRVGVGVHRRSRLARSMVKTCEHCRLLMRLWVGSIQSVTWR